MKINNKGISPLIATVLLIGFTIVLAALVIQWGGDLFKTFQSQTGVSSEVSQTCAVGLSNLDIKKTIQYTDKLAVVIDNRNDVDITKITLRVYAADGTAVSVPSTSGLSKGTLAAVNFTVTPVPNTGTQLGITPWIKAAADGKEYMCPKEIKYTM